MHEHVPMRRLCRRPGFFAAGLETYLGLARAPCARAQHAMLRGHCSWYEECSAHAKHASWRASVLSAPTHARMHANECMYIVVHAIHATRAPGMRARKWHVPRRGKQYSCSDVSIGTIFGGSEHATIDLSETNGTCEKTRAICMRMPHVPHRPSQAMSTGESITRNMPLAMRDLKRWGAGELVALPDIPATPRSKLYRSVKFRSPMPHAVVKR